MSAFLKPFNLLIIVNLLISCFALSSEEIKEIPNQHGLILKKVYGEHNIPLELEETGRVDTYKGDAEKYSLESPFGVYLAYDNNILIGAQAIDHTLKNDTLMGSVTTDILDTYQGKGYGTKLRKATGEFIRDTYFGKNVVIDSKQGISSSPLTFLHSDNEWMWGENMPSLMTALKAGYQIACIGSSSTLQMLLTQEERIKAGLWSEKRTKYLTEIGRMLSDPSSYFKEGFKQNLSDLLQTLDLTQETDIVTFFRLWEKAFNDSIVARFETVASFETKEEPWKFLFQTEIKKFRKAIHQLSPEQENNLLQFVLKGKRITDDVQRVPLDLLNFWELNEVSKDNFGNFLKETQ